MYDAVTAIKGGYEPYGANISAPRGADVRAAVATAAYRTARERVATSQHEYLDEQYELYLAGIRDGRTRMAAAACSPTWIPSLLAISSEPQR
jgi:hypothetical protein